MSGRARKPNWEKAIDEASLSWNTSVPNQETCWRWSNPSGVLCSRKLVLFAFLISLSGPHAFLLPRPKYFQSSLREQRKAGIYLFASIPHRSFGSQTASGQLTCDHDIPTHVGFICDGNSRWAKKRHLPTSAGHVAGADRFVELLEVLRADGIQYCTFYGFSTENWNRPKDEIEAIFQLMECTARTLLNRLRHDSFSFGIRLLGDLRDDRIPQSLKDTLEEIQQTAEHLEGKKTNTTLSGKLTICLAVNYGGRQDILGAAKKIADAVARGEILDSADVTESLFESYLWTAGIPDPDMIIRTSGESRLSNFLLWNCAYSEIFVSSSLWPDFDLDCWKESLVWYQQRHRRFGSRFHTNDTKSCEVSRAN